MAISGASVLRSTFGRTVLRRAATQNRTQAWRQLGRRHYASGHTQAKSSELPWLLVSAGVTVPAAVWLYGQGPKKGVHHPEAAHEERAATGKDKKEPAEEASEAKPGEPAPSISSAKAPSDEKQSTKEREEKQEGSSDEEEEEEEGTSSSDKSQEESSADAGQGKEEGGPESPSAPGQINYKTESGKGPGEGQKGSRDPPELKGEKDSHKDDSGADNPHLDEATKLEKGEGVKESSKIRGTVDTRPSS